MLRDRIWLRVVLNDFFLFVCFYIVHCSVNSGFSRLNHQNFWFLFDWFWFFGTLSFCLSFMVFGRHMGDLCDLCFVGDFVFFEGVVCSSVVEFCVCFFIISYRFFFFVVSSFSLGCATV